MNNQQFLPHINDYLDTMIDSIKNSNKGVFEKERTVIYTADNVAYLLKEMKKQINKEFKSLK